MKLTKTKLHEIVWEVINEALECPDDDKFEHTGFGHYKTKGDDRTYVRSDDCDYFVYGSKEHSDYISDKARKFNIDQKKEKEGGVVKKTKKWFKDLGSTLNYLSSFKKSKGEKGNHMLSLHKDRVKKNREKTSDDEWLAQYEKRQAEKRKKLKQKMSKKNKSKEPKQSIAK